MRYFQKRSLVIKGETQAKKTALIGWEETQAPAGILCRCFFGKVYQNKGYFKM